MQLTRVGAGCALVLALGLFLVACTSEEPEEPPRPTPPEQDETTSSPLGVSVGVVLPSSDEIDAAVQALLERDVERLEVRVGDDAQEVRPYGVETVAFAADLAQLRAERGDDLVCVLGDDGPEVIAELRPRYRHVSFCAVGGGTDEPDEADVAAEGTPDEATGSGATLDGEDVGAPGVIGVRAEELGHVLGVAARLAAGDGTVGVVLGGDELPAAPFRRGLLAGLTGVEVLDAADVLDENAEDPTAADAARAVVDEGVEVVVVDGSVGAVEAVEAIADDVLVLAPSAVLDEADVADQAVAGWRARWELILQAPLGALIEDEVDAHPDLGFAEDVFAVDVRGGGGTPVAEAVADVIERFVAGERDPEAPGQEPPSDGAGAGVDDVDPGSDPGDDPANETDEE